MCLLLADPFHPWTAASIGFSHSTCPPPAPPTGPAVGPAHRGLSFAHNPR